ncbi:hypothetical protein ABZ749_25070, partial [Micromonospora sp. NPDC047753]|uniref:hypothetical protein n=1 Tax=Micromonospora sp. NPDC047753 TaxID=3154817 RepID=UPI0033D6FCD6
MTDSDAAARLPIRLTINPRQRQSPSVDLLTWIHRRPEYRPVVRTAGGGGRPGFSDAVIIAVLAQGLLPGLFNLLQDDDLHDRAVQRVGGVERRGAALDVVHVRTLV